MDLVMPPEFPDAEFHAFGTGASAYFPRLLSDEDLNDSFQRLWHFNRAWEAVRYRYRICAECNDEFKAQLASASELWRACSADEEQNYKLERCIYIFFMSALSTFESFGFCLYFLGYSVRSANFPYIRTPKKITLAATAKAFTAAFPQAEITRRLADLLGKREFTSIEEIRNILAHRLSGRRSIQAWGATHSDDTYTHTREETLYLPGVGEKLIFDDDLMQRHLNEIARLLGMLAFAANQFVQNHHHLVRAAS